MVVADTESFCKKCGKTKPISEFHFYNLNQCKECQRAYLKAYRQVPDKKAKAKQYRQTEEYKARRRKRWHKKMEKHLSECTNRFPESILVIASSTTGSSFNCFELVSGIESTCTMCGINLITQQDVCRFIACPSNS